MLKPQHLGAIRSVLRFLAVIAGALVVANFAGSYLAERLVRASTMRLSQITKGTLAVDAVLVGHSRAMDLMAGDTTGNGPTVYNLAFAGLGRGSVIALVKEYFERGNKARFVVIEASSMLVEAPNCEIKTYWNVLPRLREANAAACQDDLNGSRFFPLTLYDTGAFVHVAYYALIKRSGDQGWTNDFPMSPQACALLRNGVKAPENTHWKASSTAQIGSDIAELQKWLQSHAPGTQLTFVLAPYFTNRFTLSGIRAQRQVYDETIGAGAYLDLANILGDDCRYFADEAHMVRAGRAVVKPLIQDYLRGVSAARPHG